MSIHFRLILTTIASAVCCAAASPQTTVRLSVDSNGEQSNHASGGPMLSSDGRVVAFMSYATNLVAGDDNGFLDVFVCDRSTGFIELASVSSAGVQANDNVDYYFAISADGRFVAFSTNASNLVPGDTNADYDVFVHDRQTGATERVSVGPLGVQGNSWSKRPSLSADGRYVGFTSNASNLVVGDTGVEKDVFVYDRRMRTCERVSIDSAGHPAIGPSDSPCLSADGRYVAFWSWALLGFPDNYQHPDIFVHDRVTGVTECVSLDLAGAPYSEDCYYPSISADGGTVAFMFGWRVYVHVRATGVTELVSAGPGGVPGNAAAGQNSVSGDGRYVAFWSSSSNLVMGDVNGVPDIFVRDRQLGVTTLASVDSYGAQSNADTPWSTISGDGRFISFNSMATNLVPGDTNDWSDVFLRDREVCATNVASYCTAKVNSAGCTPRITSTGDPSASAGSGFVIGAEQVLDHHNGRLFYGVHGSSGMPFEGGFLCVAGPMRRMPAQVSSSSGAPPCTGVYAYDFNAHIASHVDLALVPGQQVWTQFWSRDAASSSGTGLTDALTFAICQ